MRCLLFWGCKFTFKKVSNFCTTQSCVKNGCHQTGFPNHYLLGSNKKSSVLKASPLKTSHISESGLCTFNKHFLCWKMFQFKLFNLGRWGKKLFLDPAWRVTSENVCVAFTVCMRVSVWRITDTSLCCFQECSSISHPLRPPLSTLERPPDPRVSVTGRITSVSWAWLWF